jgi:hypothetical protein
MFHEPTAFRIVPYIEHSSGSALGNRIYPCEKQPRREEPPCDEIAPANFRWQIQTSLGGDMYTILLVVLILMLVGALPAWPYSRSWGYYPSGGLGLVVVILLVLILMR